MTSELKMENRERAIENTKRGKPSEFLSLTISYQLYFSAYLKFGACYITGYWCEFRVKNATLCLHTFCGISLLCFIN